MKINLKPGTKKKQLLKSSAKLVLLFAAAFIAGRAAGRAQDYFAP